MRAWHHAPTHCLAEAGAYIVTGATYRKEHFFASPEHLTILHDRLLDLADDYGWMLQAWAVFSNHYHFVSMSPEDPSSLEQMVRQLHWETASSVNDLDGKPGRKVWFNYWETRITFKRSYLARLHYVHYNPVKHGVCPVAERYPWCSAGWFEKSADRSFVRTVKSFQTDRLQVPDSFEPPASPDRVP